MSWGSARSGSSAGAGGSSGAGGGSGRFPKVPDSEVALDLDGTSLVLDPKDGVWRLDASTVGNFHAEIGRLQAHVRHLEGERGLLKERFAREHGEKLMLGFKNELLMELLAVSQLDANRNNEAYQKEALRTEALKWELGKWAVAPQD